MSIWLVPPFGRWRCAELWNLGRHGSTENKKASPLQERLSQYSNAYALFFFIKLEYFFRRCQDIVFFFRTYDHVFEFT